MTSVDGNLTALLSAAQSIGVPQPLKLFGTPGAEEEVPAALARGAISAFALTETERGLRPGRDEHHGDAVAGRHATTS